MSTRRPLLFTVFRRSALVTSGLLVGRLLGYVRELIIAYRFGTSPSADTVVLALTVPDLCYGLLSPAIVSLGVFPVLALAKPLTLRSAARPILLVGTGVYICAVGCIYFTTPEGSGRSFAVALGTLAIFPNIYTAVASSYWQYRRQFWRPSTATIAFTSVFIVCLLFASSPLTVAVGVLCASLARALYVNYGAFEHASVPGGITPTIRVLPVLIGSGTLGVIQALPLVDRYVASLLTNGGAATYTYAEKLAMLPIALVLGSAAEAVTPELLDPGTGTALATRLKTVLAALRVNVALAAVVAGGVWLLRHPMVEFSYGLVGLAPEECFRIADTLGSICGLILAWTPLMILFTAILALGWQWMALTVALCLVLGKGGVSGAALHFQLSLPAFVQLNSVYYVVCFVVLLVLFLSRSRRPLTEEMGLASTEL